MQHSSLRSSKKTHDCPQHECDPTTPSTRSFARLFHSSDYQSQMATFDAVQLLDTDINSQPAANATQKALHHHFPLALSSSRRQMMLHLVSTWLLLLVYYCAASSAQLSIDEATSASLRVTPQPTPAPMFVPANALAPTNSAGSIAAMASDAPVDTVGTAAVAIRTSSPQPTTYKYVTSDMKRVIQDVGQVICPEEVRKNSFAIYKNNKVMFDTCTKDAKYQLLPHEEGVPTPEQTTALVTSPACVDLFSGIILANFPECDINNFSVRSAAEALFRIRKDVLAGRGAPSQLQFDEFYNLNRVINLLAENASLIESVFTRHANRISLSEMTRMMNRIDIDPDVSISANMTISTSPRDKTEASKPPSSDATDGGASSSGVPVILPSTKTLDGDTINGTASAAKSETGGLHEAKQSFRMYLVVAMTIALRWRCLFVT